MARILITSELGTGYGHFAKALLLSRAFGERGHQVFAAVKHFDGKSAVEGMHVIPAPEWPPGISRPGVAVSYAEILARRGYCMPQRLTEMLRRWASVISRAAPDLLIADHAPTALLAARIAGVASARIGTGFGAPPATTPLPPLLAEDGRTEEREKIEALVLEAINRSLLELGAAPVPNLQAGISPQRDFLCTFREFDHYPQRGAAAYMGPLFARSEAHPPEDYCTGEQGIFCYVASAMEGFSDFCAALQLTGLPVLMHARGLGASEAARLESNQFRVAVKPVDIPAAAAMSRLVITHGGHGATSSALLAGCPVLLLPQQVEQLMFARRLESQRLAVFAPAGGSIADIREAIEKLLADSDLGVAVNDFAELHRGYDPLLTAMRIVSATFA